ncbi:glycosyltransferase family 2 protein [Bdellovibrio sp. 22V]|uniref:glycosyltransferase family 2 protein n=1 Tax=Bdellovibrio sp. 22V TaxID=3044166 RepID=UPI00254287E0|nr:glycosyltransferase family 2 protein [Bdellovibrio sp. 22V]WII71847.1 glycosyltransferase family 2 protein [Bdellovibrio sp. 22V]
MKISVVIPTYGAPNSLSELHRRLVAVFAKIKCEYEVIFVNDACPFDSWSRIKEIQATDSKVIGLNLVRNFGQHAAIAAGLQEANGDWITVMDCDLQDDPSQIDNLLEVAQRGFDVVLARRAERKERPLKRLQSFIFYKTLSTFLDVKLDHRVGNYGLYSRRTIDAVNSMDDRVRFFPYLVSWLGFPTSYVDVTQHEREEGKSSYTFRKALKLAFDFAISSSNKPLIWSVQLGALCALGSFTLGIVYLVRYFTLGLAPSGWTSLIVTIFFATGIILINLGILGLYLARTYDQTRHRPTFIIGEKIF